MEKKEEISTFKETLASEGRYHVYSFMLYFDDFSSWSQLFPEGPVHGCFLLLLNLPLCHRRAASSIWTVPFSPAGMSSIVVFGSFDSRYCQKYIEWFGTNDALHDKSETILNLWGLPGDYLASLQVLGALKHIARAPCITCTFGSTSFTAAANIRIRGSFIQETNRSPECLPVALNSVRPSL